MLVNLDYLKSMSGDNPEFIKEMIGIFKVQISEYAEQMPELIKSGEYLKLSKLAHKAKSSVAVMGMTRESELLKELEILAKDGQQHENYMDMVDDFIEHSQKAIVELDSIYQ